MNLDRKTADRIVKGNPVVETEENQCFVKCLYQTFGIIDEEGDFLPEVARLKVPKPLGKFKEMVRFDSNLFLVSFSFSCGIRFSHIFLLPCSMSS